MKKITTLLLVVLAALFFSCGKDDDGTKLPTVTTLLTIKVNQIYLDNSTQSAYVIASKADGTLLAYKEITNDTTITLETEEEGITEFTATLFQNRTNDPNPPTLFLNSYPETPVGGTWTLGHNPFTLIPGSAALIIEGTGEVADWPKITSSAEGGALFEEFNGGLRASFSLFHELFTMPTLAIYQSLLDNQVRYYYNAEMQTGTTVYAQHADLPVIPSPTIIDFGEKGVAYYAVGGRVAAADNRTYDLPISFDYDIPATQTEQYIPQGVFNKYFTYCGGQLPNSGHSFSTSFYSDAVETNFTYPNFDFEVNATANSFDISTDDDISEIAVFFTYGSEVNWQVRVPNKNSFSFNLPTLPTELMNDFSTLSNPLTYSLSNGYRYDPPRSTTEFYEKLYPESNGNTNSQPPYGRLEIITKQ
ncbi:MAG: hypothetical protein IT258_12410 [Saprospiraceae bacterium]|nr:hypothetical protein [Saprospiraceae bacterium]